MKRKFIIRGEEAEKFESDSFVPFLERVVAMPKRLNRAEALFEITRGTLSLPFLLRKVHRSPPPRSPVGFSLPYTPICCLLRCAHSAYVGRGTIPRDRITIHSTTEEQRIIYRKAGLINPFDEISIGILAASPDSAKYRRCILSIPIYLESPSLIKSIDRIIFSLSKKIELVSL